MSNELTVLSVLGNGKDKAMDYLFDRVEGNLKRYFQHNYVYDYMYEAVMDTIGVQIEEFAETSRKIGMARIQFGGYSIRKNGKKYALVDDFTIMVNIRKLIDAAKANEENNKIEVLNEVVDHETAHIIQYIKKSTTYDYNIYYQVGAKAGHNVEFRNIMRFFGYRSAKSTIALKTDESIAPTGEQLSKSIYYGATKTYNFYSCHCPERIVLLNKKENGEMYCCSMCDARLARLDLRNRDNRNAVIKEVSRLYNEVQKKKKSG